MMNLLFFNPSGQVTRTDLISRIVGRRINPVGDDAAV